MFKLLDQKYWKFIDFIIIDTLTNSNLSIRYKITSIPTIIVIKNWKYIYNKNNNLPNYNVLDNYIKVHLNIK